MPHGQRVVVVVLGVLLLIEPLELLESVVPALPVAEPEAPMLVPLPVLLLVLPLVPAEVSALVLGAVGLGDVPAALVDDDEVGGGVVVEEVDVEVSVVDSRWQADSDSAAIRARAAQRARGWVVIRTLLERL
jgi:hypothetical protein